jgi:hypothetical protein
MARGKLELKVIAAAAAASLLCSQAAAAATPQLAAPVDPLVALSALGTAGSSAAVCGTAAQTSVNGCVLAMNDAAQPADTQTPPPEAAGSPTPAVNILPLLIVLGVVVAVGAVLVSGSDHGHGNLSPVSPA